MWRSVAIAFVFFLHILQTNSQDIYRIDNQNISVVEGHAFRYICKPPVTLTRRIWWQKNTTDTSRFFTNGNILNFLNTSRQDAGTYSCFAETVREGILTNITMAIIKLNIQYPAKVTQLWVSAREIDQYRTLSISCTVEGNPVDFKLLNVETQRQLVSGDAAVSFTISMNATCIDEGTYACTANNFLNNSTLTQQVYVWCPPQIDNWHPYPNMKYAKLGDNLTFDLAVWADPQPEFTWFKSEWWNHWLPTPIPSDRQNNTKLTTSLKIQNVGPSDFGNYTVMVKNRLGTLNSTFNLQPQGPPEPPSNLRIVNLTSTTVTLDWFIGYNYFEDSQTFAIQYSYQGLPFQTIAYTVYYSNQVEYHMNYTVSYLSPDTQYFFRVYSSNRYGNSDFSNTVQFVTYGAKPWYAPSLDTKMIAAVSVVGGLMIAILVVISVWWIRRRRNCKGVTSFTWLLKQVERSGLTRSTQKHIDEMSSHNEHLQNEQS
ncbi:hypothetical protein ACJMK2_027028 [Sinanodonta woodiana]|uniref:Uncharacterized protein n=1 Tax=Sinanodonta woodiana TaxID=1069815 RepID=A0ABD3XLF3_SINWO